MYLSEYFNTLCRTHASLFAFERAVYAVEVEIPMVRSNHGSLPGTPEKIMFRT
ncbi:hypothetical protein GUITHDRAFT_155868 [Guillardia theta CCMP2712]|uniref:Uncharacterized protein n=1 Tax=Guillardia theta (strain CCMP2712) TaxID=905079 RepID=L1ID25_GUITC|nr:hypothetical protein GUITHDRAFT_155868 [Guillardia theta CCMP2712]EKX33997.1 hypothetical protein GUITHDRAFT_155868 [Guillardia theta CCMP2712]|eukprot:XP_005820977.1 hypothetical protein GUITHDRAFT_155868 [Guillardia theta CCMP2712]